MKELTELEKDVGLMNECLTCGNFEPFQRVLNAQRASLYEQLKTGDATDVLKMQVTQKCLDLVENILQIPAKLQAEIDRICQRRENMPQKVNNIQRKREMMV
jgi:hypothetical protein